MSEIDAPNNRYSNDLGAARQSHEDFSLLRLLNFQVIPKFHYSPRTVAKTRLRRSPKGIAPKARPADL